ncbi:prolyl oligopeptidase family serine peptidase [Pedobacter cryoconitis]|uniref:Dipeptidyl aminopeptidase/acylaminoacyl peptidase n=1 Tax=Pedobacter cryoconitis TaxID=188932 RepID=A0A7X0J8D7_9SPHI|nr:prolyl oligopeptidase family serine peptidase [Pedobacter cryoconitis]MBB6502695.1 dipeptidyl aminopeptidase/acylaminoacyl peptidase [Pedobacter cryoconitis]
MTVKKRYLLVVLIALFSACRQNRQVRVIPVADFFKSQEKGSYAISLDGKTLSYLKAQGKKQNLFVEDLVTGKSAQITQLNEKNINYYFWASNDEIVYYKEKAGADRLSDIFIINKTGANERRLSDNGTSRMRVLKDQLIDGKFLLVSSNKRDSTVFDVYRLNVRNGHMDMAAKNPGNITDWITDSKGKIRLATASDGVNQTLLFREKESQAFRAVVTNNFKTTLKPIAISDNRPDIIYAISNVNRDKNALIELNCITGKESKVLFSNDTLNVVDAQYSESKKTIAFVICETWKKEKHYLDTTVKKLYEKLDKLLPGTESRIIDRDKAENTFIVRTFTDRNPGSYYLYVADKGTIRKLSDFNPYVKEAEMCEMKPVSYKARDGLKIQGYLTLPMNRIPKNLPVVVLPHDGPGRRNSWGYNAEVQFLANRGYAVFQVNYRGSSGYGKSFAAAGSGELGGKIKDDINDGVRWLVQNKIANPRKIAIYGTGLGGYIALNSLYSSPGMYACGGSNSGVINLFSYLKSIPPFWKTNLQMFYEVIGNPLTGGDRMRQISPVFHADKFRAAVFIAQSPKDPRSNSGEAIQFVKELKKRNVNVTYLEKEYSEFSPQGEEVRQTLYASLEQFLSANLSKK